MASIVLIKEAADSVPANGEGHATHVFTVTNEASRRQPVGLQVLADDPGDSSWFHIEGMPERELDAGASYQIKVNFQAPAGTPEGRYTFRLLVYSAIKGRADEDFSEGPTVGVTVSKPDAPHEPEPEPPKNKFPWPIVAAAAALVLLIGIGVAWWLWPSGMEVGIDRPGSDFSRSVLDETDPQVCKRLCDAAAQCEAWTYVKPGVQGPKPVCYLKRPAPAPVPNDCCTSGIK